jgi:thiol-disulfide isomerase/thioredoxin
MLGYSHRICALALLAFGLVASLALRAATLTEVEFKEKLHLTEYKSVGYRAPDGSALDYARFMALVGQGGHFSMIKNPEKQTVVLKLESEDDAKAAAARLAPALKVATGAAMPKLEGHDLEGRAHAFTGKPTLLSFFFAECLPCIQEVPDLNRFAHEHPQFSHVAVTFDAAPIAVKFVAERKLEWSVVPNAGEFIAALGVTAYPTFLLVSADGRLLGIHTGGGGLNDKPGTVAAELNDWAAKLLAAAPG